VQQATWTSPMTNKLLLEPASAPTGASGAARHIRAATSRSWSDDGAVHGGLRWQRQHREPGVSIGHLSTELPGHDLAGADRGRMSPARTA
jgi:hypothetical protein